MGGGMLMSHRAARTRSRAGLSLALAGIAGASLIALAIPASAGIRATDWPAYLDGPRHWSDNHADAAITPATAASLALKWHAAGSFLSSPAVADGAVFIGATSGEFYKYSESTGKVLDKVFLGHLAARTCPAMGFVSTATVSDYFDWSSPTVASGRIYVGISSSCDSPLIRGGVAGYYQGSGKRFATFYTVPAGYVGGSVWSSAAVDSSGYVYIS